MALRVRQVMTAKSLALPSGTTLVEAATAMREQEVSDVLVYDYGSLRGIVSDRDITIRAVAEGFDPTCTSLAEVCSRPLHTVTPDDTIETAADLMRRGETGKMVAVVDGRYTAVPIEVGSSGRKRVDVDRFYDVNNYRPKVADVMGMPMFLH